MSGRFFAIAFALCWLITIPIALNVQGVVSPRLLPPPLQYLIGFAPIIAAWWVTRNSPERTPWLASAFRAKVSPLWYVCAIALPWLMLAGVMAFDSATGRDVPKLWFSPQLGLFGLIWLVLAFGEEAGWRAFALPQMLKTRSFWPAATVLGAVWCVWHYPRLFSSPYLHFDAQGASALAQFSLQILVANYLICWFFVRTQSAVVTAFFHASVNTVATAYAFAAMDPVFTIAMAAITVVVVLVDRGALRAAGPAATI